MFCAAPPLFCGLHFRSARLDLVLRGRSDGVCPDVVYKGYAGDFARSLFPEGPSDPGVGPAAEPRKYLITEAGNGRLRYWWPPSPIAQEPHFVNYHPC